MKLKILLLIISLTFSYASVTSESENISKLKDYHFSVLLSPGKRYITNLLMMKGARVEVKSSSHKNLTTQVFAHKNSDLTMMKDGRLNVKCSGLNKGHVKVLMQITEGKNTMALVTKENGLYGVLWHNGSTKSEKILITLSISRNVIFAQDNRTAEGVTFTTNPLHGK